MDFRVRQGSVKGLQFHPDPDALVPVPDLFPGEDVENTGLLDLGGNLPNHRENVAHRHPDREDARHVPENRRKLRQRRVSTRGWRRSGRLRQADLRVKDGSCECVFLEQLLADRTEPTDDLAVPQDVRRLPFLEKRPESRGDDVDRGCARCSRSGSTTPFMSKKSAGASAPDQSPGSRFPQRITPSRDSSKCPSTCDFPNAFPPS